MTMTIAIARRGTIDSSPSRVAIGSAKSRLTRSAGRKAKVTMFFLLIMTAMFVNNGASSISSMGICAVVAFQPSQQNHGGNHNQNKNNGNGNGNGRQQNYPARSNTYEPRSTEFPKTSTPEDGNNGKSGMFSPMNGNEDRNDQRKGKKRRQAQKVVKSIWETSAPILVEASSLHTIDFEKPSVERVQVLLKKSDMNPISGNRKTNREPLIARVDLWHGPDSTPQNLAIYLEEEEEEEMSQHYDDEEYDECQFRGENDRASSYSCDTPFSTIIETPHGHNTIAIRNIAESCDLLMCVEGEENEDFWYKPSSPPFNNDSPLQSVVERLKATTTPQRIDSTTARKSETGDDEESKKAVVGSCTVELPSKVASVQVLLQTDYMQPIQARIELELRMTDDNASSPPGPGTNYRVVKRTIVEVYSEDGMHRPFFAVLETPRKSNRKARLRRHKGKGGDAEQGWFSNNNSNASYSTSMKVVNLSTTEFPLFATVEPHAIDDYLEDDDKENDSSSPQRPESDEDDTRQEWTHFGGGSNFDLNSNSTILDAEIL